MENLFFYAMPIQLAEDNSNRPIIIPLLLMEMMVPSLDSLILGAGKLILK